MRFEKYFSVMVTVKMISEALEQLAPLALQESYDNAGLQVGNPQTVVHGVLTTLDITEAVLAEAENLGANLIVAHHPILFKPLKRITDSHYSEKLIRKAIELDIALYASHTNLDSVWQGVNDHLAKILGLSNSRILRPNKSVLRKLEVFVPENHAGFLLEALGKAGAGQIGKYKDCSFRSYGIGAFTPGNGAHPAFGEVDKPEEVEEMKVEVIFPEYLTSRILKAMKEAHPYEEVAYYLLSLDNLHQDTGIGCIGELNTPLTFEELCVFISKSLKIKTFKHSIPTNQEFKKLAVCGGSGSFLIKDAISAGAEALITSDVKYHDYFESEGKITLVDVGHYESETHSRFLLADFLSKKFPNIAVNFSKVDTNPVVTYIN